MCVRILWKEVPVGLFFFAAMIYLTLRKHCTLTSLVKLVCSLLTVFLIYQELVNFLLTRPTTVSSEEKTLDQNAFPDIFVCLEPGINSSANSELGYNKLAPFFRGSIDGDTFVGWNGMGGNKNNVEDILNMKLAKAFH